MKAILMAAAVISAAAWLAACGSSNPPPPPEQAGQACMTAAQCYPETDGATLMGGAAVCLDRVTGGYCTHLCNADTDCCALPGECKTAYPQLCSPFESTGLKYCFLSCEDSVFADAGISSADSFCGTYAHVGFGCRSSGGGNLNRKVCVP